MPLSSPEVALLRSIFEALPRVPELSREELDLLAAYLETLPPLRPVRSSALARWSASLAIGDFVETARVHRRHLEFVRLVNERRLSLIPHPSSLSPGGPPPPPGGGRPTRGGRRGGGRPGRYKSEGTLPEPVRDGGGGRAAYYEWGVLGPWLSAEFGIMLPPRFPGNRNRDHA